MEIFRIEMTLQFSSDTKSEKSTKRTMNLTPQSAPSTSHQHDERFGKRVCELCVSAGVGAGRKMKNVFITISHQ